jgi:acyl-[acyl carrier protein]--UDP-N-acetylglucosamine O-acyltransferase
MKKKESQFNVGDKVHIVKYGHYTHAKKEGKSVVFDYAPSLVGKVGVIDVVKEEKGEYVYAINEIEEKYAWYNSDQLSKFTTTIN